MSDKFQNVKITKVQIEISKILTTKVIKTGNGKVNSQWSAKKHE